MTFRRDVNPLFAALMDENGGSLTNGETKGARVKSTGRLVAGETKRSLKICLKNGQETLDSVVLGRC